MDDTLKQIFARFVRENRGGTPIGRLGNTRVTRFLDLLSAAHDPATLDKLVSVLAKNVGADPDFASCEAIVGPKNGNCLLVKQVAATLNMKTSFVRDSILFNRWIEGPVRAGQRVFLIDDVGSDPESLVEAVENLRHDGVFVLKAWVLVHRKEFEVKQALQQLGTQYLSVVSIGDEDLAGLAEYRVTSA